MVKLHDYEQLIDEIIDMIRNRRNEARAIYPDADSLAALLLPDMPANTKLFDELSATSKWMRFTDKQLIAALNRQRKANAKAKVKLDEEVVIAKAVVALLGEMPRDERHYVALLAARRGYRMTWDRCFYNAEGKRIKYEELKCDCELTAADLHLVKPRGEHLSVLLINTALEEWTHLRRRERLGEVWNLIATPSETRDPQKIFVDFAEICGYYFVEPEYAAAAISKFIWSVKRRMRAMTIVHMNMFLLVAAQGTGKGAVVSMLCNPVAEISSDTTLPEVLDPKQQDLPAYYVLKLDELTHAARADVAALKTFITGSERSGRPMRTNISTKVECNATLIGTSNTSLGTLIFDSTGMRRFIEIKVKDRKDIEPHWDKIVAFDWLGLWQAIDETSDDPLMSKFGDKVRQEQEALRTPDNTEQWLTTFDVSPRRDNANTKEQTTEYVDWYAAELFKLFRDWEETYCPSFRGTSLSRWGRDMKSLIDNGHAPAAPWQHFRVGNKTVYRFTQPNVVDMKGQPRSASDLLTSLIARSR